MKYLSKKVDEILVGFEETKTLLPGAKKVVVTGTPTKVRKNNVTPERKREIFKELNIKNIYEAFFENIDESLKGGNFFYNNQTLFNMSDIINGNGETVFANYLSNNYIKKKQINWYTRNYIGFKNLEELSKFKENFDENDVTNNPLYQISNDTLYPNIELTFLLF